MPPSIADREKLISGFTLLLIAGLFLAAFVLLRPSEKDFQLSAVADSSAGTQPLDELELAYLRARIGTGEQSPTEVTLAVGKMIRAQQFSDAWKLLSEHPDVQINESDRYRLELEMSVASEDADKAVSTANIELTSRLHYLVNHPSLQSIDTLLRASRLSHKLADPGLSANLYAALGHHDKRQSVQWFEQCEMFANTAQDWSLAQSCLGSAIEKTADAENEFALKLRLLENLAQKTEKDSASPGSSTQQDILANELLAAPSLGVAQLESLAATLLAVERPHSAIGVFEELATNDPERWVEWLDKAVRWSVATSQNVRAVALLDRMRPGLDDEEQAEIDQRIETLLIAAGEQDTALKRARKRLESIPDDAVELSSASVLAQQSGDLPQALRWNTRLLSLQSDNGAAINRQVSLLLATGELEGAYGWARKAVALQPDNVEARVQLAKISEWTARPYEAVEHWQAVDQSIALNSGENETSRQASMSEVVRLAELTLQPAIAAGALQRSQAMAEPGNEQTVRLVRFHELDGKPHFAAIALENTMQQWGETPFRLEQLAALHRRHAKYESCLLVWQRYQSLAGDSPKVLLNLIEMHWRLGQTDKAVELARQAAAQESWAILPGDASDYQVMVLSEIGWRYRQERLILLTRSRVLSLQQRNQRSVAGKRLVDVMVDLGQADEAIAEALMLWQDTGDSDFAIKAMDLAFARGDKAYPDYFLTDGSHTLALRQRPQYWSLLAAMQSRNQDPVSAEANYRRALALDPANGEPLGGLLWLHIGRGSQHEIAQILQHHDALAQTVPQLWAPFAVAHLQLGNATASLQWFARLGDSIDTDYNMLLLYADALALANKADQALELRAYALQKLRPLLTMETLDDQSALLRQYARLLGHYGSAEEQEQLTRYLLASNADNGSGESSRNGFWREDMAIGWLMSTQRHEQARIIMAQIQQQRLATPEWQLLALAIKDQDRGAIESVLALGGVLSAADRVLALRTLGDEARAQALLATSRQQARSPAERDALAGQYAAVRSVRPGYAGSLLRSSDIKGLSITEVGVTARHSFDLSELGVSLEYVQRYLESSRFLPAGRQEESDLAVALHFGGQQSGGYISTGFLGSELAERVYVDGLYFRTGNRQRNTYTLDIAYNENIAESAELRLGAVRHRVGVTLDSTMRNNQFINFHVNASQIQTRVSDNRFARGLQARIEYGFRGSRGANIWRTSVVADSRRHDREDSLPVELQLTPDTTLDSVLAEESTSLSIGASLGRGDVNSDFPQVSSPRYHLATRFGHTWPDDSYGLQLDAGAGVRLLGGDELSFGLSWEWLTESSRAARSNNTSFGMNYKYHF